MEKISNKKKIFFSMAKMKFQYLNENFHEKKSAKEKKTLKMLSNVDD